MRPILISKRKRVPPEVGSQGLAFVRRALGQCSVHVPPKAPRPGEIGHTVEAHGRPEPADGIGGHPPSDSMAVKARVTISTMPFSVRTTKAAAIFMASA